MANRQEFFANLLGRAAMDVWGDMPRDIREALFETAMKGQDVKREELARLFARPSPSDPAPGEAKLSPRRNRLPRREFTQAASSCAA